MGYLTKMLLLYLTCFVIFFVGGCSTNQVETTDLKHYPMDSLEGLITKSGVMIDKKITSDSNGSSARCC